MINNKACYEDASFNLDLSDQVVKNIQPLAERVRRPEVISDIGPFSGLFELKKYNQPVIVSSTDGVGTKLKVAFMVNKHDTIGIDLVAMSVNDIITSGAQPLFFLDYISSGKIYPDKIIEIVKGIVNGCKIANCSLIGGDTSQMPGVYNDDEYELAGFAVGVVEKDAIIDSRFVESGDDIIGLASSGLHCHGFNICRKLFFDNYKLSPFSHINCLNRSLFEELLEPTKIYSREILAIKEEFQIKAIANITEGGFIKNIPRSIPKDLQANIYNYSWELPQIFNVIKNMSELEYQEMLGIFNMGIGMTLIVKKKESSEILKRLENLNCKAYLIGKISRKKQLNRVAFIDKK